MKLLAIVFLLGAIFAWGSWTARNDDTAMRKLAAEKCSRGDVVYVSAEDAGRVLCLAGSERMKR
jgi:hypothetical protein